MRKFITVIEFEQYECVQISGEKTEHKDGYTRWSLKYGILWSHRRRLKSHFETSVWMKKDLSEREVVIEAVKRLNQLWEGTSDETD